MPRDKKWLKRISNKHLVAQFVEEAMVDYYLSGPFGNIREVFDQNRDLQEMRDEILARMTNSR